MPRGLASTSHGLHERVRERKPRSILFHDLQLLVVWKLLLPCRFDLRHCDLNGTIKISAFESDERQMRSAIFHATKFSFP